MKKWVTHLAPSCITPFFYFYITCGRQIRCSFKIPISHLVLSIFLVVHKVIHDPGSFFDKSADGVGARRVEVARAGNHGRAIVSRDVIGGFFCFFSEWLPKLHNLPVIAFDGMEISSNLIDLIQIWADFSYCQQNEKKKWDKGCNFTAYIHVTKVWYRMWRCIVYRFKKKQMMNIVAES